MKVQTFDYSVDLLQGVIWQYDEATHLLSLINQKQIWYNTNQTKFWTDWYNNVFNLLTANTFGLSVWSYILNVPLYLLNEVESSSKPIWGFNSILLSGTLIAGMNTVTGLSSTAQMFIGMTVWDNNINIPFGTTVASIVSGTEITLSNNAVNSITEVITFFLGNSYLNFGEYPRVGNQGSNFSIRGKVITLTEEEQRFVLRLRYFQLSNRIDVTDVNKFLNYLIMTSNIGWPGTIYMLDNLNMTITYHFTAPNFPPNLLMVLETFDVLPRPAGVEIIYSL